jgi:hypothetical protein
MACRKQMAGCPITCGHRQSVEDYRCARAADEALLEYETRLFDGDVKLWKESNKMMTFGEWLRSRGQWLVSE